LIENPPLRLYQYRSFNPKYLQEVFVDRKLHFSDPTTFNDPFDCLPRIDLPKSVSSIKKYSKRLAKGHAPQANRKERLKLAKDMEKSYTELRGSEAGSEYLVNSALDAAQKFKVLCLSENSKNILMWSHYASNHQGVCLEFELPENEIRWFAREVKYTTDRPRINPANVDLQENYELLFLTKAHDWCYEKEWRVILEPGNDEKQFFKPSMLKRVIFGAKITQENEEMLRDWVRNYHGKIQISKAKLSEDNFEIEIIEET